MVNSLGKLLGADRLIETHIIQLLNFGMFEMGLVNNKGLFRRSIKFSCHIVAPIIMALENLGPFFCLQGDTIGAGYTKRNKAYIFPRFFWRSHICTSFSRLVLP